jgi:nitrile hydratase
MVLPMRPANTEGFSETALVDLVTRDSMVGVSVLNSAMPQ